jgi:hypothetical protein
MKLHEVRALAGLEELFEVELVQQLANKVLITSVTVLGLTDCNLICRLFKASLR